MIKNSFKLLVISVLLSSCAVVVPVDTPRKESLCQISNDRKTLRVIDVAKETNTYYSVGGVVATPILFPSSAIISGAYVGVYNIYHIGKEQLLCKKP